MAYSAFHELGPWVLGVGGSRGSPRVLRVEGRAAFFTTLPRVIRDGRLCCCWSRLLTRCHGANTVVESVSKESRLMLDLFAFATPVVR